MFLENESNTNNNNTNIKKGNFVIIYLINIFFRKVVKTADSLNLNVSRAKRESKEISNVCSK